MSRIIKSAYTNSPSGHDKVINVKLFPEFDADTDEEQPLLGKRYVAEEIIEEAQSKADVIIQAANQRVEEIYQQIESQRESWKVEAQHLSEVAKQEGFMLGMEQGREKGFREWKEQIDIAKNMVELSKVDYQKTVENADATILDLGIKVAKKIIGLQMEASNEAFESLVRLALKEAREYEAIQLHVHPTQYEFLVTQKVELEALFPRDIDFYIFPNEDLKENDCLIESTSGRIDASVDSQLEEIRVKLAELLEEE